MHSSVLTTTFTLFLCANAGNIDLEIQPGLCNIYEKSPFVNVSQIIKPDGLQEPISRPAEAPRASETPKPKKRKKLSTRWTTKPSCISDEAGQEYCVFTNANFANGRGISFFTTPTIAENVKDLPAFQEMGIHDNINDFSNPPWELPEESKKILLRTAAHNPGDMIMERINTNAFAGEFEGMNHFFLYPETALMNHDCRPNAMYYHNISTLVHSAHASRTINIGEEITITYLNLLQSNNERQETLKMIWGFDCDCKLCSASELSKARSDLNIEKINELHTTLSDWSSASEATPKLALNLLSLYEKEHLHAAVGTGHMFAALAYNAVGDTKSAVKHAKLALDAGMNSLNAANK
ncbi:putative N-lysine methyltransferase SMYD2 [Glarea lozoyensis 74030]|uniref:Putative N-lysine methyltransferase SMYD2 n=1 Tax=Glarea lozoyensis (strain ATCC 74030 / MF5533) TaxID=1104152 RepID=H0ET24_GLAL7|nr:putative N-lysine methyltransferase SMYD2 [Glarea lozoyensis 74030]